MTDQGRYTKYSITSHGHYAAHAVEAVRTQLDKTPVIGGYNADGHHASSVWASTSPTYVDVIVFWNTRHADWVKGGWQEQVAVALEQAVRDVPGVTKVDVTWKDLL